MMFRFEKIVSDPNSFVNYLKKRFNVKFDEESLRKGILLMDKRPIEKIIELDINKIKTTLKDIGCKEQTIDFVVNEQKKYIESL